MLLTMLSSLRMSCPSCRPFSQIGTLTTTTYVLLLPPSSEAMQPPCSGVPPTATFLAMRLLTAWQRGGGGGGTAKEQVNRSTSYSEVKTILNAKQRSKRSSALAVLANQTTEHLLQSCPLYELLRKGIWPDHTPVALKLCDSRGTYDILPPSSRRLVASWTPQVDPPCTPPPNPQGPTTTIPKCT